jgi:hypothetical protein
MKKLMILMVYTALCTFTALAQEDKSDRIESYKIAFITEKLDLTPKEAAAFWPVYNEYNELMKKIRDKSKERSRIYREKTAPTDHEAEKYITDHAASKHQEQELTKKYVGEFKKVLPVTKVAKLITLEQEFKMQLLRKLKDHK